MHLATEGVTNRHISAVEIKSFISLAAASTLMTVVVGPTVVVTAGGYIGWAIIAESHISVHYIQKEGYLWFDLFSCKDFDPGIVMHLARTQLHFQELNRSILPRGLERLNGTNSP